LKVAVIGSRSLTVDVEPYIPKEAKTIISGGAKGVDRCAAEFAKKAGLELIEFLPDYRRYGRGAPLRRNNRIIDEADLIVAIWDGKSKGTLYQIERARKLGKPCEVVLCEISN
jgi:hypothetical protein